jgi:predicted aspartyl protease
MGEVDVLIRVINPATGVRSAELSVLADTGATLSVIPGEILDAIGIERRREVGLSYADGRRARRHIGEAVLVVNDETTTCRVLFGEEGDAALLGLATLEQLALMVDPIQRRLVPTDYHIYALS